MNKIELDILLKEGDSAISQLLLTSSDTYFPPTEQLLFQKMVWRMLYSLNNGMADIVKELKAINENLEDG